MDLQILTSKLRHQTRKIADIMAFVDCLQNDTEHPFFFSREYLQLTDQPVNYVLVNTYDSLMELSTNDELDGKLFKQLQLPDKQLVVTLCQGIFCYDNEERCMTLYAEDWTFEKMLEMPYKSISKLKIPFVKNNFIDLKGAIIKSNQSWLHCKKCSFLRIQKRQS